MPVYESRPATLEETIEAYIEFAEHVMSYLYMAYHVNVPKLAGYLAYATVAITGVGKIKTTEYGTAFFCIEGWKIIERICHELNKMF